MDSDNSGGSGIKSNPKLEKHLKEREVINPKTGVKHRNRKGIVGAHNELNFMNEKPLIRSTQKYMILMEMKFHGQRE